MTFRALIEGSLFGEPVRRTGASGKPFVTAKIRSGTGGEESGALWVSVIAFGDTADRLAELHDRADLSVSGRAELTCYQARAGEHRAGLSLVIVQIATLRRKPKAKRTAATPDDPFGEDELDDVGRAR